MDARSYQPHSRMHHTSPPLLSLLLAFLSIATAASAATNRTIDDQQGDSVTGAVPSYSPVEAWSQGSTCDGCYVQLDTAHTFDGTWHDSTHTPGDPEPRVITAQFTGTAVYVYNVLANYVEYTTTLTSLNFTLDGDLIGSFIHIPTNSTSFQYDVPVFVKTGLSNTSHTIVITAGGDINSSLVLFDYIVYTFEEGEPSSTTAASATGTQTSTGASASASSDTAQRSSSISVAAVAGGVAGGVAAVLIAVALFFLFCRRHRRHLALMTIDGDEKPEEYGRSQGGELLRDEPPRMHTTQSGSGSGLNLVLSAEPSTYHPIPSQPSLRSSTAEAVSMLSTGMDPLAPLRRIPSNVPRSPGLSTLYDSRSPLGTSPSTTGRLDGSILLETLAPTSELGSATPHSHGHSPWSSISATATLPPAESSSQSQRALSAASQGLPIASVYPNEKAQVVLDHMGRITMIPPLQTAEIARPRAQSPGTESAVTGISTLRDQVAVLQQEIERIREQQELQRLLDGEAPPQYVEA